MIHFFIQVQTKKLNRNLSLTGKLFALVCSLFVSCRQQEEAPAEDALFRLMPSGETGISFINEVTDTKEFNIFQYRNFYNGAGVAVGDINNDGYADIFFTAN